MSYLLLAVASIAMLAAIGLPIVSFLERNPRRAFLFTMLLVLLATAVAAVGAFGRWWAPWSFLHSGGHFDAADWDWVLLATNAEGRACLTAGLAAALVPLSAACVTLSRALAERPVALLTAGGLALGLGVFTLVGAAALQQSSALDAELAYLDAFRVNPAALEVGRARAARKLAVGGGVGLPVALAGVGLLVAGARAAASARVEDS
ncbi:MAG: hypothetical protein QM765_42670 [Myxococcales bacterium]